MHIDFSLRPYRTGDFAEIVALDGLCFEPDIAYPPMEMRFFLSRPRTLAMVAESIQQIVGFEIVHMQGNDGHVITIDVRPDFRKRGVASGLFTECEVQLRAAGVKRCKLEVSVENLAALAFYEKHGFRVVRRLPRYYLGRTDGLGMEKNL